MPPLARFVAVHAVAESQCATIASPKFAVVLAREAVARELTEEAGCTARNLDWLCLVEVNDGAAHFGAVFGCETEHVPAVFQSDEIGGIDRWRGGVHPAPLGDSDAALLGRFG